MRIIVNLGAYLNLLYAVREDLGKFDIPFGAVDGIEPTGNGDGVIVYFRRLSEEDMNRILKKYKINLTKDDVYIVGDNCILHDGKKIEEPELVNAIKTYYASQRVGKKLKIKNNDIERLVKKAYDPNENSIDEIIEQLNMLRVLFNPESTEPYPDFKKKFDGMRKADLLKYLKDEIGKYKNYLTPPGIEGVINRIEIISEKCRCGIAKDFERKLIVNIHETEEMLPGRLRINRCNVP